MAPRDFCRPRARALRALVSEHKSLLAVFSQAQTYTFCLPLTNASAHENCKIFGSSIRG